jgi:nucleotide-binding universal stress UspA family protein
MKTNRVLIPVDGSEFSLQVLPYVMRLLDPAKTELVLMRVAPWPKTLEFGEPGDHGTIYLDQREESMEAHFYTEMLPYMATLVKAGFSVSTAISFGDPAHQIEQFIPAELIDMVAMTTHGRTGLSRMVLGSVAQHVVNHASVPVLLFRPFGEAATQEEQFAFETANSR